MTKPMMKIGASALCAVVVACLVVLQTCSCSSGAADDYDLDAARQELELNEESGGEEAQDNQSTDGPIVRQSDKNNLQYSPDCGAFRKYPERVVYGLGTRPGEFPSVMAIAFVWDYDYTKFEALVTQCTGVLVSSRIALTAAHCMETPKIETDPPLTLSKVLVKPSYHLPDTHNYTDGSWTQAINVCQSPNYNNRVPTFDLAVIILPEHPVFWFNDTVRHVCLPEQLKKVEEGLQPDTQAWLVGNGHIGPTYEYVPTFPQKLALRRDACGPRSIYEQPHERGRESEVHPSTICFMPREVPPGMPCPGDSGAPIIAIKDKRQFLYGIHSVHKGPKCDAVEMTKSVAFDVQAQRGHLDDLIYTCRRDETSDGLKLAYPPPPRD